MPEETLSILVGVGLGIGLAAACGFRVFVPLLVASLAAKANLFTPFQGSAQKGGTGLGLPIAAELIQLHGGTIILDESQDRTCFKITIPDRPSPLARASGSGPDDAPETE